MSCTFCEKSASKLVTRSLCDCCLVHMKCCDATAEKSISVVWEEDAFLKVECDICLEEYQENELQQHRATCMPRMVFRCSLCDEDYLSEESLWNHLTVHQIAYVNKELYYQQKRVSYKQHECILCNDQRSYQESSYWLHVHDDHDGYYLKCSECGDCFRSKKRKADHDLNHCRSSEKISFESDGVANINEHSSHERQNEGLYEEDVETNKGDQQSSLESEVVELYGQNSTLGKNSEDGTNDNADKDVTGKESEVVMQPHDEDRSSEPTNFQCSHCYKDCSSAKILTRHIECCHLPSTCDICGLSFSSGNKTTHHKMTHHSKLSYQCPTCSKAFRSKGTLEKHIRGFHQKTAVQAKTDCPLCRKKFSDQGQVEQHVEEMHKMTICTICREIFANADELNDHKCSMCPHCGKGYSNRQELITHIELRHDKATCDVCEASFCGKRRLWYHKLRDHSEPKMKCPQCSKKFRNKSDYNIHLSVCVKKEYKCILCGLKLDSLAFVPIHMKEAHGITRSQKDLADCSDSRSDDNSDVKATSEDLMSHDESDHNFTTDGDDDTDDDNDMPKDVAKTSQGPKFKGKKRKLKFTSKASRALGSISSAKKLKKKRSYNNQHTDKALFPCKLCGRKFNNLAYVKFHMKQMHSISNAQIITEPNKELNKTLELQTENSVEETQLQPNDNQVLNDDIRSRTNIVLNEEPNRELEIKMEISVEETHLQQNESQVLNDGGGKYIVQPTTANNSSLEKCPRCDKYFKKTSLKRHITENHRTRICRTCGIFFQSKRQLAYHVMICHTAPKYKCTHCHKTFHVKTTFIKHEAKHKKVGICGSTRLTIIESTKRREIIK